jgi:hypothetical protein
MSPNPPHHIARVRWFIVRSHFRPRPGGPSGEWARRTPKRALGEACFVTPRDGRRQPRNATRDGGGYRDWEGRYRTGGTSIVVPRHAGYAGGPPKADRGGKAGPRWRPQRRALGGFEAGAQAAVPAFERGLETTPAWRLFRGLVDTLKQWASDRGADRIVWETRRGRPRAWARIGGTPISTVYELLPRDGRNDQSVDSTALTTE